MATERTQTSEARAAIERGMEAWNRGDLEGFLATASADIDLTTMGSFPGLRTHYHGRKELREFWAEFHEPWEEVTIAADRMIVRDAETFLILVRFTGRGRDGISVDQLFGQRYIVRDGLVADLHGFKSWEEAVASVLTPDAVIFDNDGLLLATEAVWSRGERDLYERRGLEFTLEEKQELVGTSADIAGGIFERRLGEPGRAKELILELDELVMAELENGVEAMPGARELVARLHERGTPMALASNSPRAFIERALEIVQIGDVFDAIVSGHEVAEPKPAPDPFLEACRQLGVEPGPNVVGLEDSPVGVASAVAAGLRVIGVPSVPGIELDHAHHDAESLADPAVYTLLGFGS